MAKQLAKQLVDAIEEPKRLCGQVLAARGVKLTSKAGYEMVVSFYVGYYKSVDLPPYVSICLACGRINELVIMP